MIKDKEFLLAALLAYSDFKNKDVGKSLFELLTNDKNKKLFSGIFSILLPHHSEYFLKYFNNFLKRWEVFYIDDRRFYNKESSKSGYYAVCFRNNRGEYILAFRGSELYPIEDAYLDFIHTDLLFGIGKIPEQFFEGIETYQNLLKIYKIDKKNIYLTGHSLGGGIAQYVAVNMYIKNSFIPFTKIFNSIGINKKGIFKLENTVDFTFIEENFLKDFKYLEKYKEFLLAKLKLYGKKNIKIFENVDAKSFKKEFTDYISKAKSLSFLDKISFNSNTTNNSAINGVKTIENFDEKQDEKLFDIEHIKKIFMEANLKLQKIQDNKIFEERIINYGHSEDLTNNIFKHFGTSISVDKNFIIDKGSKEKFIKNFNLLGKAISNYHYEDVFLPFLDEAGNFSNKINFNFIAASIRKVLSVEDIVDHNFLADYLLLPKVSEENFKFFKLSILSACKKYQDYFIFKKNIILAINQFSYEEFSEFYSFLRKRIASPYRYLDIFDVVLYERK